MEGAYIVIKYLNDWIERLYNIKIKCLHRDFVVQIRQAVKKDYRYIIMNYRFAEKKDAALILSFIKELADYEKMADQVVATEELLAEWVFEKKKAEVIFALSDDGKEVGFALFFHNFSTFLGRAGLYLEDLFVKPEYRGEGYGKGLLKALAEIAVERGCGRFEWWCLDWNTPSIDFYKSMGAVPMSDWTVYRIAGNTLEDLGKKK